ncbi:MAG: ABC transporter permease [Bacteroidota bacterium]
MINLIGLTTGLTCAFFIYLWVQDEYAIDKFHEQDERLYQVMGLESFADEKSVSTYTPGPLGEALKADFPDIRYAATTTWINPGLLSHENTFLRENGYHVGRDFFKMFTYPLLTGDPNSVLNASNAICLSRELANKFFGSVEAAMGKTIRHNDYQDFTVTGVFENISEKSSYVFDFVLPLQAFLDQAEWANEWSNTGPSTYVVLEDGVSPEATSAKITNYVQTKTQNSDLELFLKKYSDQYLQGRYTNGVADGGRIDYVKLFLVIAVFILVIACINFMNLSTARASKRALEVGIRKAIGAGRGGLIRHYLGEALLMSFLALLLSFVLAGVLLGPFNAITGKNIVLTFSSELILISVFTVLVTGILAGSYPAFYLSHFQPIQVLKGDIKSTFGEVWARKGLVIFQFTMAIMLIIGVVVIHRQTQYLNHKPLGYERDNVIFFSQDGGISGQREAFLNELRRIPGVVQAGTSSHGLMGRESSNPGLQWEGKDPDERILFERFYVDHEFYETMGFQMAQGRWFSQEFASDSSKVIINEAAAKVMGISSHEALGQQLTLWEGFDLKIIGVVQDFHYMSLHKAVEPAAIPHMAVLSPWPQMLLAFFHFASG